LAADGEDQVALRGGRRYAARLAPRPAAPPRAAFQTEGCWLITGGLGALGRHMARWLAGRGATHLVLTGRRGLDTPGAAAAVAALEGLGIAVTLAAADVADEHAMAQVLAGLAAPLTGIVHAAGVSTLAPLAALGPEELAATLAAKAGGARVLDRLSRDHQVR